jgi:hypothetical protein
MFASTFGFYRGAAFDILQLGINEGPRGAILQRWKDFTFTFAQKWNDYSVFICQLSISDLTE